MDRQIVAMLLGIAGSLFLHLSKGLQRFSIDFLDTKQWTLDSFRVIGKNGIIYIIAFFMNYSYSLWMLAAVHFAPVSSFTSVYSVGVLGLLVFSKYILKEHVGKSQFIGNIIIVAGSIALSVDNLSRDLIDPGGIDVTLVILSVTAFSLISGFLIFPAIKSGKRVYLSIVIGMFTGGLSSFEPVLKSIALHIGTATGYLPTTKEGWIFFWSSFLFVFLSFYFTQFGFTKKAPASILVSVNNLFYSISPIFIQLLALPGYNLRVLTSLGISLIISGGIVTLYPLKK